MYLENRTEKVIPLWRILPIAISVCVWFGGGFSECCTIGAPLKKNPAKFLLILFDGFRWDYLEKYELPNFNRFRSQGVHAEYMEPIFPSLSYPGYYSILTGLHAESHGFIENTMYDPVQKMFFFTDTDVNGSKPFWWEGSEPVWTTATKSGKKTYVYLWPGCHVLIHNTLPTYFEKYVHINDTSRVRKNLLDVLERFALNQTDVGIVYSEYTDIIGHKYGPESKDMKTAVLEVDNVIGELLDEIENKTLKNKLNVIIVSDHGMTATDHALRVKVTDVISLDDVEFLLGYGATVGVHPVEGKLEKVYSSLLKLKGVNVWKKADIPEDLHFKHHFRVPEIQIVANSTTFIEPIVKTHKQVPFISGEPPFYNGFHGYIPKPLPDMRAIFLAMGPDFKENLEYKPIHMTDVYNLMVYITGLKGHVNNGSWSGVRYMLKNEGNGASCHYGNTFLSIVFVIVSWIIKITVTF